MYKTSSKTGGLTHLWQECDTVHTVHLILTFWLYFNIVKLNEEVLHIQNPHLSYHKEIHTHKNVVHVRWWDKTTTTKKKNLLSVHIIYNILKKFWYIFFWNVLRQMKKAPTILLPGKLITLLPSWNNTAQIPEDKVTFLITTFLFVA